MANINFAAREVNCKIVYYGPGRSGKTTNLEIVHQKAPKDSIGEMVSIATETDRTLFFDFLPLDLGTVAGMRTKFQLYTVPGQVYYNATRKLVLQGADGVVFVADSQRSMHDENIESLLNLEENLRENGLRIDDMPLVIQYNKRDLDDLESIEELNSYLNRWNAPNFPGVAVKGDGVFPTLKALASLVIKKLNEDSGYSEPAASATPPPKEAPAATPAPKSSPQAPAQQGAAPTTPPPPAPAAKESTPKAEPAAPKAPPPPAATPAPPPSQEAPRKAAPATPPPPATQAPKPQPAEEEPAPKAAPHPPAEAKPAAPPSPPANEAPAQPAQKKASPGGEKDRLREELEKRRAAKKDRDQAARERIHRQARKPIKQKDNKTTMIVVGLLVIVAIAIAIIYFAVSSGG